MSTLDEAQHGNDATLSLNDLPMDVDRDGAWAQLAALGDTRLIDGSVSALSQRAVEAVMKHAEVFSSKKAFDILGSPLPLVPIAFDPPEHTRYRQILQPFFSPRSIRPIEDELRRHVVELIEPLVQRGECEFIADVAQVFPVQTFIAFFGLPYEDLPRLMAWKDAILNSTDAAGAMLPEADPTAAIELFGYINELVLARRGVAGEDVLSQLLCIEGENALSDMDAVGLCFLFVLAGLDTVAGSLGLGMERLALNPERRQELVDDPSLIDNAIEELVRLDPPAPFVPRVTACPADLLGQEYPEDTRMNNFLAVANRDPSLRPHPEEIDFHRSENPHASFGLGAHRCLGSHLARLEMRLVYEEWHKRIPNYHITPGTEHKVKWPRGTLGLESLHLTFGPAETV